MQRQAVAKACAVMAGLVVGGSLAAARPGSPAPPTAWLEERPAKPASAVVVVKRPAAKAGPVTGLARLQALEASLAAKDEARADAARGLGDSAGLRDGVTPEERAILARGNPDWTKGMDLPDLPVDYNPAVQRQVVTLTSDPKVRKRVEAALRASGRYSHLVVQILRENALPEDLVSVVFASSGFQPEAVSARGDAGLWQLSATEAVLYGLTVKQNYDERRDVELATRAVAKRLAELHEKYSTWELALAAFHLGDAALSRVPDVGEKSFWDLLASPADLPRSTGEYVPLVLATALVLKNRRQFQLDGVRMDAPLYPASLQVPAGMDLSLVARAAGTSLDQIKLLNPAVLSEFVPSITRDLTIQVPSGSSGRARMLLAQVMGGYGSDEMHRRVPSSFDWGRDELPGPTPEFPPARAARAPSGSKDPWLLPPLVATPAGDAPPPAGAQGEPKRSSSSAGAPAAREKSPGKSQPKKSEWADLQATPSTRPAQ